MKDDVVYEVEGPETNREFEKFVNYHFKKNLDGLMLDIGCGDKKLHPRFAGVDPYAESDKINLKAYMWDTPFEDNSVDFLVCMAALEHISKFQVVPTLREFSRILKPGAAFAIIVPNLEQAMINWLNKPTAQWEMDMIFGSQEHEGEYHRTGFSVDIIKWYFAYTELEIINIYDVSAYTQWNFGIIGKKKENDV
jgi:predicted SAM-dependent methyltransferase